MLTAIIAGPLIGFVWAGVNAAALGSQDRQRQWLVFGAAAATAVALRLAARATFDLADAGSIAELVGEVLLSASYLTLILGTAYMYDRQEVLFTLHVKNGTARGRWSVALLLIAVAYILKTVVFPDTIVRSIIGGIT
ncbi:MAG: hypothetical protein AAGI50_15640 [Pseudomonadota bacterium]